MRGFNSPQLHHEIFGSPYLDLSSDSSYENGGPGEASRLVTAAVLKTVECKKP